MEKLRVFLVDDHAVVRLGLMTLLEDISWVEIAGEAGTAEEAITAVAELQPDVVLMDIRLPDQSGIIACATITSRWPQTRVIMLTSYADDNLIRQAQIAGACFYIPKVVGNQPLIEALERMIESYFEIRLPDLPGYSALTELKEDVNALKHRGGSIPVEKTPQGILMSLSVQRTPEIAPRYLAAARDFFTALWASVKDQKAADPDDDMQIELSDDD